MKRRVATPLLLLMLALAGCTSAPAAPGGGPSGEEAPVAASSPSTGGETSGGAEEAALSDDLCSVISSADIGAALGAAVTTSPSPGGGCDFKQEDVRAPSGSVTVITAEGNGGIEGYLSGINATFGQPVPHEATGIGERAVVVTGTITGGENTQAAGVAKKGGRLLTVTLVQGNGLSEDQMVGLATALLAALDSRV